MSNYPDPDRYPPRSPERVAADAIQLQQSINASAGRDQRAAERRERIATAALQAMELPNGGKYTGQDWNMGHPQTMAALAAKLALVYADALIAELDKGKAR